MVSEKNKKLIKSIHESIDKQNIDELVQSIDKLAQYDDTEHFEGCVQDLKMQLGIAMEATDYLCSVEIDSLNALTEFDKQFGNIPCIDTAVEKVFGQKWREASDEEIRATD